MARPGRILTLALLLSGCASPGFGGDDDGSHDGGGGGEDAAGFVDASVPSPDGDIIGGDGDVQTCSVHIELVTPESECKAPGMIEAKVVVDEGAGELAVKWRVRGPGNQQLAPNPESSLSTEFRAGIAGEYRFEVDATVGGVTCPPAGRDVLVGSSGTALQRVAFRLMYTPTSVIDVPGEPPAQDNFTTIVHGQTMPPSKLPWTLLEGSQINAVLKVIAPKRSAQIILRRNDTSGQPVGRPLILFSDEEGKFAGKFPETISTEYNMLVVPFEGVIAPFEKPTISSDLLASLDPQMPAPVILDAGQLVEGTVFAGTEKVVGAVVSVASGDLPPALAITGPNGTFSLHARAGDLRIEVVPRRGDGYQALRTVGPTGLLAGQGDLTIQLAPAGKVMTGGTVVSSAPQSAPLFGARVTYVSLPVGSGSIQQGNGPARVVPASETRVTTVVDGSGRLVPIALPATPYQVIVQPPASAEGEALTVSDIDLSHEGPSVELPPLVTRKLATFTVTVKDANGLPIKDAKVSAIAHGRLGLGTGETVLGLSTDDIAHPLPMDVPPGMDFDLVVDAPRGRQLARKRVFLRADDVVGTEQVIQLRPAVPQTGSLVYKGVPLAGARVSARCEGNGCPNFCNTAACIKRCGGDGCNDDFLYAETVSDSNGNWVLLLPDLAAGP